MTVEWIELNLPWGEIDGEDSFTERGLNLPGTEIQMEDGTCYLIGDINASRGTCSCCTLFWSSDIVKRYRVLIP